MVRPREGSLAMKTSISLVSRMKLDMSIPRSLVFEKSLAEIASEGHLVRMDLVGQGRGKERYSDG